MTLKNLPKSSWLISTKIIWPNKLNDQPGPSGGIRWFKCTVLVKYSVSHKLCIQFVGQTAENKNSVSNVSITSFQESYGLDLWQVFWEADSSNYSRWHRSKFTAFLIYHQEHHQSHIHIVNFCGVNTPIK